MNWKEKIKRSIYISVCWVTVVGCFSTSDNRLSPKERLGKRLFFDTCFSEPRGQSCAACHDPARGFADPDGRSSSEGAVKGLFSRRNAMSITYSAYVPPLHYDEEEGTWVGGLFWDGRANSLEEQMEQPFINPLEMSAQGWNMVVERALQAQYQKELEQLFGKSACPDSVYKYLTQAIAAYERSREVNPFSSKFDAYLAGKCTLTETELRGMDLFKNKGMCAECHVMEADPRAGKILFTDHTYDNLGIPPHEENPFYRLVVAYNPKGRDTLDLGLGAIVGDSLQYGKFRVPTLRNIALTAPYGHNGYFQTLEDIVHFYNVRDISTVYPPAEYAATLNRDELGNLKLTPAEEADLVVFMKTLTDGYLMP